MSSKLPSRFLGIIGALALLFLSSTASSHSPGPELADLEADYNAADSLQETKVHTKVTAKHDFSSVAATTSVTDIQPVFKHDRALSSFHQRRTLTGMGEWFQLGPTIDIEFRTISNSVSMSKNGLYIVIGGAVLVYKWNGSFWEQMGDIIAGGIAVISADGMRVAVGSRTSFDGLGRVRVFEWQNSTWEQLGDSIFSPASDVFCDECQFGRHLSMSAEGQRIVSMGDENDIGPSAFEYNGTAWVLMPAIDMFCFGSDFHGCPVAMAGNGERLAIGFREIGLAGVYEWDGLSWKQIGSSFGYGDERDGFGRALSMSHTGDRVVVGATTGDYVRVFEWRNETWVQMGDDLLGDSSTDDFGDSVFMSSDGLRIVVGSPQYPDSSEVGPNGTIICERNLEPAGPGYARIFEWDGSKWVTLTDEDLIGDRGTCDDFGGVNGISMSGDGNRVAIQGDQYVRTFEFQEEPLFPPDFFQVTCSYLSCLGNLRKEFEFGSPPAPTFEDTTLNKYTGKSFFKTSRAKREIKDGKVVVSVDRLQQAMKWIQRVRTRAIKIGDSTALDFSNSIGDLGSTCATNLVQDFINNLLGEGLVRDSLLKGRITRMLNRALTQMEEGDYRRSVMTCLRSIRVMIASMGIKQIPVCE